MQISRHWRLNSQRYRLEGIRYQNGEVSLQNRPVVMEMRVQERTAAPTVKAVNVTVGK